MKRMVIRDLKIPVIFIFVTMIPLAVFWSAKHSTEIFPVAVFVQASFTFMITILSVMLNEQYEDVNNGYKIYQSLPVRMRDIIAVKFLIFPGILVFLGIINRIIFLMFPVGNEAMKISDSVCMVFYVCFLVTAGMTLTGIFVLGYTKFIKSMSAVIAVVVFGSMILSKLIGYNMDSFARFVEKFEKWLTGGGHTLFYSSGIIIYILLGVITVRTTIRS